MQSVYLTIDPKGSNSAIRSVLVDEIIRLSESMPGVRLVRYARDAPYPLVVAVEAEDERALSQKVLRLEMLWPVGKKIDLRRRFVY